MGKYYMMIDGGTSNTRFTLAGEGCIAERRKERIGVTEGLIRKESLREICYKVWKDFCQKYQCRIQEIYASGMITSHIGMTELSHLDAPVSLQSLAEGIHKSVIWPEEKDVFFYLVPGVRFMEDALCGMDVMRGEETEIFGLLKKEEEKQDLLMIHFGSHNKLIHYDRGLISGCITTISGELLWALSQNTILRESMGDLEEVVRLDEVYVEKGYRRAEELGLTRALFMARTGHLLEGSSKTQTQAYLYGALTYEDMQSFFKFADSPIDKIILYGRQNFIMSFLICLKLTKVTQWERISERIVTYSESEEASFWGCERLRHLRGEYL